MDNKLESSGPIFIVGNSRSGTTMLMRALNLHSNIHAVNEPHFWERLYLPGQSDQVPSEHDLLMLMSRLLCSQRQAFQQEEDIEQYKDEASNAFSNFVKSPNSEVEVYAGFLSYEADRARKRVACEKTPRNVFYIQHILEAFPNALVVNIARDPRSVLLSQKMKWKRKRLGSTGQPQKERLRLRLNYHPWIMSKLWVSGIKAAAEFENHQRFLSIRFEDFVKNPAKALSAICERIGLRFEERMLEIPFAGSSTEMDESGKTGIRPKNQTDWAKGLSKAEIAISDRLTRKWRHVLGYDDANTFSNPIVIGAWYLAAPIKLGLALFFNLGRYRNIWAFLKKRF